MISLREEKIRLCTCGKNISHIIRTTRSKTTATLFIIVFALVLVLLPFGDLGADAIFPIGLVAAAVVVIVLRTAKAMGAGHSFKCALRQAYLSTTGSDEAVTK